MKSAPGGGESTRTKTGSGASEVPSFREKSGRRVPTSRTAAAAEARKNRRRNLSCRPWISARTWLRTTDHNSDDAAGGRSTAALAEAGNTCAGHGVAAGAGIATSTRSSCRPSSDASHSATTRSWMADRNSAERKAAGGTGAPRRRSSPSCRTAAASRCAQLRQSLACGTAWLDLAATRCVGSSRKKARQPEGKAVTRRPLRRDPGSGHRTASRDAGTTA